MLTAVEAQAPPAAVSPVVSLAPHVVLLTGFGPFGSFKINPSSETARLLDNQLVGDAVVHFQQLEVSYEAVMQEVPRLWTELQPCLVVHVGVSGRDRTIVLEQCGRNGGYTCLDVVGCLPPEKCCRPGGPDCLLTTLDAAAIAAAVQERLNMACTLSDHAGQYLCDFAQYTSLHFAWANGLPVPVLFVHIPPEAQPYSIREMSEALRVIIQTALCQDGARCCPAVRSVASRDRAHAHQL